MQALTTLLSLADYAVLDEPDDVYVTELVRGVLVREPRPGVAHGRVQVAMAYHLKAWGRGTGASVTSESGYILSEQPATLRGPDVAVVVEPRLAEVEFDGWIRGAPDVAVEVLSPSDTSRAIHQKTLEYLEAGTRLVWILDPAARTVTVYRPDGSANVVRVHQTLDGEDVLHAFSVPLVEVFEP